MLGVVSTLAFAVDAGSADYIVKPMIILLLCVLGGIGTILLLPGPKQSAGLGGVLLALAGLAFGLIIFRAAAGIQIPGHISGYSP